MNVKDTIKMQEGISFLNLIKNNKILVPKIQRDYAQGRLDIKVSEIRDNFLTSIFEVLTEKDREPLLLDFIYGSTHNNLFIPLDGQQRLTTLFLLHWYFIPENNRQLLYKIEGNSCYSLFSYETRISSKDFCNALVRKSSFDLKEELFSYKDNLQTQISDLESNLRELENNSQNEQLDSEKKRNINCQINNLKKEKSLTYLSTIIKNQSWFLWSWRKDPTVKAMLVMLDEIEVRVKDFSEEALNNIWEQLEKGKIIFHLLPLEQFALTDELYVKMNARGKELSPFDIFKSSLEEQMQLNNVSEEIQNKWKSNVDSNWIDLFWNKLAKNNIEENTSPEKQKNIVESVEKGFLVFFKRIIGLYFVENISSFTYDINDDYIQRLIPFDDYDENNLQRRLLEQAIQKNVAHLFPLFYKTAFFDESFFRYAIDVFDNLIYLDENRIKHDVSDFINAVSFSKENITLFDSFISEAIDYEAYLLFYSLMLFCRINYTSNINKNIGLNTELNQWIRIIRNLSTLSNSFIDNVEDFQTTLKAYQSWCEDVYGVNGDKSIINYIANTSIKYSPKGRLMTYQVEEERIKATLFQQGKEWQKEISEIEEHGYFLGQIRFLLNWSEVDEDYDLEKFKLFKNAIIEIFDSSGLKIELCKPETHLFRNSLMANFNYYMLNNVCFVNNGGKDRDRSWKSYLRSLEKSLNIKNMLDKFISCKNVSYAEFCKNEIESKKSIIIDWRRCFIHKPEIYNKCEKNQIDYWPNNNICLLETSIKWIGFNRHSELNTYYWYLVFNLKKDWVAEYYNSQTETPLLSNFTNEGRQVSVQFENAEGEYKYIMKVNFNPNSNTYTQDNDFWVRKFDTKFFIDVENELGKLLI